MLQPFCGFKFVPAAYCRVTAFPVTYSQQTTMAKTKVSPKARCKAKTKSDACAPKEPRLLIDKADDKAEPKSKLRRRSEDGEIKKCIYDNFRGFSDEEIYCREVDNVVLFDRLKADRAKWKAGGMTMGPKYYMELRKLYANGDSISNKLVPNNESDAVDPLLQQALEACVADKSQLGLLMDWAESVERVNNYNLVCLFRHLILWPVMRNLEYTTCSMRILAMIHRLKLHMVHVEPWEIMKPHFDKTLCSSLKFYRDKKRPSSQWWRANRCVAGLLVPEADCTKAIMCENAWGDVADEVKAVYASSAVGKELMEAAIRQLSSSKVSDDVEDAVAVIADGEDAITLQSLSAHRSAFIKSMAENRIDANKAFDKPIEVDLRYRGVVSPEFVTSPLDHYNMRVASLVRSLAVDQKLLPYMWCEHELVGDRPAVKRAIETELLTPPALFRETLNDLLSVEELSAHNIEDTLKKEAGFLVSIDSKSRVEMAFWRSSIGDKARERVHQAILRALPCEAKPMSLVESLLNLGTFEQSKLLSFAGVGLRSQFSTIHGFVKTLKASQAPNVKLAGDSHFMSVVRVRLGFFLSCTSADVAMGSTSPVTRLYGEKAAVNMFNDIVAKFDTDEATVSYADVAHLQCFSWLLTADQMQTLRTVATSLVTMPGAAPPLFKKQRKGGMAPDDAKELVAALFSRS